MGDEDINDVYLVGTDGEEVPCCKAYMTPYSPVFRSMFSRGFREQTLKRCNLHFHSLVISLVVKYCYTGELDMDSIFSKNRSLEEGASILVEVREAGRYFQIDDLFSIAEARIVLLVFQEKKKIDNNKKYQYAPAFLRALLEREELEEPLTKVIFRFTVENAIKCFGPSALKKSSAKTCTDNYLAHPSVLVSVLAGNQDTYTVVQCLQTWFAFEKENAGSRYSDKEKVALLEFAANVDLKKLSIRQLSNVKPCSVFSLERIHEAFVHHGKNPLVRFVDTWVTKFSW